MPAQEEDGRLSVQSAREFLLRPRDPIEIERTLVTLPGRSMTITASAEMLFRAIAPTNTLFYRGGTVMELIHGETGPEFSVLDAVGAQSRFEKYAMFHKPPRVIGQGQGEPAVLTEAQAKQYLKSEACRTLLPRLRGMVHCPFLTERDGQVRQVNSGYDPTTGIYVIAGNTPPQSVSLEAAVDLLDGLLADFDFLTPSDKSRALASLITPALKMGGFVRGQLPIDVGEANTSQSGKGYRQKLIGAVYNSKLAVVAERNGGVGSMDEAFCDHLIKGRMFIQLDNLRGKLDSTYIESFMTGDGSHFNARSAYHKNANVDPSEYFIYITSNGFEATKDLTNRASIIRIRKRENYAYRLLNGRGLLELASTDFQPFLLGAVFAVVEEWVRRGKPRTDDTRHDFREWCQTLDWIVQNIFHSAPLMDGHENAKARAANPHLTFLRALAINLNTHHQYGRWLKASNLADRCIQDDVEVPGISAAGQTSEAAARRIGKIMGGLFENAQQVDQHTSQIDMDGLIVRRRIRSGTSDTGNRMPIKEYQFSDSTQNGNVAGTEAQPALDDDTDDTAPLACDTVEDDDPLPPVPRLTTSPSPNQ